MVSIVNLKLRKSYRRRRHITIILLFINNKNKHKKNCAQDRLPLMDFSDISPMYIGTVAVIPPRQVPAIRRAT